MKSARLRGVAVVTLLVLSAGCSNSTAPVAGTLDVNLSSPHSDDGAVLLSIAGGRVDSVEASGFMLYSARGSADTLRLIVIGNLGSGPVARLHISDTRQASRYSARIGQVAARSTYRLRNLAEYGVTLLPE